RVHRRVSIAPNAVNGVGQSLAIERMEKVEPRDGFRLVSLEMADEVPPHRGGHRLHLRKRLLNPVLADVAQPSVPCRLNGVRAVGLRYGDDRHLLTVSAAAYRRVDLFSHITQPIRKVRKRHKPPNYRRLQVESSKASCGSDGERLSADLGQESTFKKYSETGSVAGRAPRPRRH